MATVMESSPIVEQNQPPLEENLEQNQPLEEDVSQNQPPPEEQDEQNQPPEDVEENQLPIPTEKTPIMDFPSLLAKAIKRDKPAKKKAKAAMVDLVSSPSKRVKRGRPSENEGEVAMVYLASSPSKGAMVDLVSSPSKGVTFVRHTKGKTRAQRNVMIVSLESESVRIQSIDRNEVHVLFNDKVLKKCKFTLCWVHALIFLFV